MMETLSGEKKLWSNWCVRSVTVLPLVTGQSSGNKNYNKNFTVLLINVNFSLKDSFFKTMFECPDIVKGVRPPLVSTIIPISICLSVFP